jgi:hypothetical protein
LKMYETIQGYNSKVFQEADLALFTYARCWILLLLLYLNFKLICSFGCFWIAFEKLFLSYYYFVYFLLVRLIVVKHWLWMLLMSFFHGIKCFWHGRRSWRLALLLKDSFYLVEKVVEFCAYCRPVKDH